MALSNWNIYTTGGWGVSTAQAVSPTHSMAPVTNLTRFRYNGNTSILNARVIAQIRITAQTASPYVRLWTRNSTLNPVGNGYTVGFRFSAPTWIAPTISRWNTSAETPLLSMGYTAALNTWYKFRFSVTTEIGYEVARLEQWSGSVWNIVGEYNDSAVNKVTAAGMAGFDVNISSVFVDDIEIISLSV